MGKRILILFIFSALFALGWASDRNLQVFKAENTDGNPTPVVIVCPGGSYSWLDIETEGIGVARWLQGNGITAVVLPYRVQGVPSFLFHYRWIVRGTQYPDALNDLQDAICYVRRNAEDLNIDPKKLGAMGFSAGGHLVASSVMMCDVDSLMPNFVAPIYPVVTMQKGNITHKRSRRALLGEYRKHSDMWRDSLSLEKHVRKDLPPLFLVNCKDDPIVDYRNSELLDSALTANKVPHEYHQYNKGGHGFGADPKKASEECIQWRDEFLRWMSDIGMK